MTSKQNLRKVAVNSGVKEAAQAAAGEAGLSAALRERLERYARGEVEGPDVEEPLDARISLYADDQLVFRVNRRLGTTSTTSSFAELVRYFLSKIANGE